jgi:TRAP-type C4-dicarboxylate transport system permease large subunit
VTGIGVNRYLILLTIIIFYMLMGCALNVIPVILITLPAIYPTVVALGFDPIWFGVISVILMEMGQITPPIGIICFAVSSVAEDVPIATVFKGIFPFVIAMMVCIAILILFPKIALFLPELAFRG